MKKIVSALLCITLIFVLLAGCQGGTDVPYVTGDNVSGGQQPGTPDAPSVPGTSATTPGQTTPGQTNPGQTNPGQTVPAQTTPAQTTPGTTDGTDSIWSEDDTPVSQPTEPSTSPEDFVLPTPEECTYLQYQMMTGEQQEQFFAQFKDSKGEPDFAAFFAWLDKAKAEYDANNEDIELDPDATIDWDEIFGKEE